MRLGHALSIVTLSLFAAAGRADTISTFSFTGSAVTFGLGGDFRTVSGVTTIDTTTGVVQSLSFTEPGSFQSGVDSQLGAEVFVGSTFSAFSFSAASLIGYNGSTYNLRTPQDLYVGSTTLTGSMTTPPPSAVTPELSSIALLGTGLLSMAGLIRRRSV